MAKQSTHWNPSDLSHRFTVSFFRAVYADEPAFVTETNARKNKELNYYNVADYDNTTEAQICAGQLVVYMENQGIPYHKDKTRAACYATLADHLKQGDGLVLKTADIVDDYFKFLGE